MRALGPLGLLACAAAVLLGVACGGAASVSPSAHAFDGERAFQDLVDLVRIGPRPPGSEGAERTRALIRERLAQAGWPVEAREFAAAPPGSSPVAMVNLVARTPGERDGPVIAFGAHYDTKRIPGLEFAGANDGASGVALLLELARVLSVRPERPFPVWLLFFDGEEAFGRTIRSIDGLYGSKALAAEMQRSGELDRLGALIVVDMVADRDLNLTPDATSSSELRALLVEAAERLDDADLIDPRARTIIDDHTPFLERGLEDVLLVIDFQFGARITPGPYWHTTRDDLDAVSAASLNRAGRLVVELLAGVERRLQARARGRAGR